MKRVEICGNIASGKTTLCKNLTLKGFTPIFENFQKNPFIKKFYEDPGEFSFETEITFLLQHYHAIKLQLSSHLVVCDFSLFQDIAYADVNLEGNRHKLFLEMAVELQNEILFPSKLIHIRCPEDILIERIKKRNREIEKGLTIEYLIEVNKAISFRVAKIKHKIQIISLDSDKTDFTDFNRLNEFAIFVS
jgi:deoxyadenosine/deoxycytidine kinase